MPDVVSVCPAGWPIAAGEGTSVVPQHERSAEGSGGQAALPPDVQHLAGGAEDGGDDAGVAGQPPGGGRGEVGAVVERASTPLLARSVVVDRHDHLGPVAAVVRQLAAG